MDIKITTAEIKKIKRKLDSKRLLSLPPKDICIYTLYRIKSLVSKGIAISYSEIEHNMCEVGPGNRRLDPWTLNIVLQSNVFNHISTFVKRVYNGIHFYSNKNTALSLFETAAKLKFDKIVEVQKLSKSSDTLDNVLKLINMTAQRNGCVVVDNVKEQKLSMVDCEIHSKEISTNNLLIRFCNSDQWIYPDSHILWTLFVKSFEKKHIPVLIAPYIHGSCFQLFKSLGMFARASYYLFASDKVIDDLEFIKNDKGINLNLLNFSFKRCESVKSALAYGEFDILAQLLSSTVPKHYPSSTINAEKMFKRLLLSENINLKNFIQRQKQVQEEKIQNRIKLFEQFINLVNLGRITDIKKMVKRCLKLVKGLESST